MTRQFQDLPEAARNYSPPESSLRESEFVEIARPLRTFDLFAGCGGLSHGLERSGCAKVEWAVEIDGAAAESFQVSCSLVVSSKTFQSYDPSSRPLAVLVTKKD